MVGTILNDRYQIVDKIEEDEFIEVFRARCNKLNRYNTIKILKKEYMNDTFLIERFKEEATALAKLTNSNIVNIYDVVYQGDIYYMVMEYVIGKNLKELIIENVRLSYERTINIAVQIAKALDYAHKNNIVHGNIRPENIQITEGGTVKVANFTLIKSNKQNSTTNLHEQFSEVTYFSPEQLAGKVIDARTDIYSLGLVMYEMITGKLPFKVEKPLTTRNRLDEGIVVEPIQINSSIPVSLNNLIMKCLEKDPNRRYKNASEILIDLLSVQNTIDYETISTTSRKEHTQVMPAIKIPMEPRKNSQPKVVKTVNKSKVNTKTDSYSFYILGGVMIIIIAIVAIVSISDIIADTKEEVKVVNTIVVPNVTEKFKDEAKKAIEDAGLVYREVIVNSNEFEENMVISTNPEKGTTVNKGQVVEVKVSSGIVKKVVPNLIGKYESEAKVIVPENGFKIGKTKYIRDGRYVKYHVVDQEPKPGEELEEGGVITYTVNLQ